MTWIFKFLSSCILSSGPWGSEYSWNFCLLLGRARVGGDLSLRPDFPSPGSLISRILYPIFQRIPAPVLWLSHIHTHADRWPRDNQSLVFSLSFSPFYVIFFVFLFLFLALSPVSFSFASVPLSLGSVYLFFPLLQSLVSRLY